MPGANRAYRFLDPNTIALLALVFRDGRSGANLLAYPTATASTLRRYAVRVRPSPSGCCAYMLPLPLPATCLGSHASSPLPSALYAGSAHASVAH